MTNHTFTPPVSLPVEYNTITGMLITLISETGNVTWPYRGRDQKGNTYSFTNDGCSSGVSCFDLHDAA